jgi:hypothetical protein
MEDDEYFNSLMHKANRTLDDVANDVRQYLSGAVENIIKAGQALQEGRDMHPSNKAFSEWCEREFPELERTTRHHLMKIGNKFSVVDNCQHRMNYSVLRELAAPSVPDELVEDFLSSEEPVKVEEVREAKKGYKKLKEDPDCSDIVEQLQSGRKTAREAAKEAWERSEKKRKQIEENPQVVDLEQIVKNKKHYDIKTSAISFVVAMEQMGSKSEPRDIAREINMAIQPDPMNIKVPALFLMRDILNELCEEIETPKANQHH